VTGIAALGVHLRDFTGEYYLCAPLVARGDTLGVLHLRVARTPDTSGRARPAAHVSSLVESISEYVSLALANQVLRDTLRNQAIRDPLTGLFNRRFAEETLDREV
jgi:GAF domain-containing protein